MQEKDKNIIYWVKQLVRTKEWNEHYSQVPGYCYLDKGDRGVWMGFMTIDKVPFNCKPLNEAEKIKMQEYRESNNIFPQPFEEQENERKNNK